MAASVFLVRTISLFMIQMMWPQIESPVTGLPMIFIIRVIFYVSSKKITRL